MHDAIATHSRGLTKEECEKILAKNEVNAIELESLLEARDLGFIDFNLVDTREWMEWVSNRIKGTDYLIPTTSFSLNSNFSSLEAFNRDSSTKLTKSSPCLIIGVLIPLTTVTTLLILFF